MALSSVAGVRDALLALEDEDVVPVLAERDVGAARLMEEEAEVWVGRRENVCARDIVALEDFAATCCFGLHQFMRGVGGSFCGGVGGFKMNVRRHEVALRGLAHGMTGNIADAVRIMLKDEGPSSWFCCGRRRHELPGADLKLAVEKNAVHLRPLCCIRLTECLFE